MTHGLTSSLEIRLENLRQLAKERFSAFDRGEARKMKSVDAFMSEVKAKRKPPKR